MPGPGRECTKGPCDSWRLVGSPQCFYCLGKLPFVKLRQGSQNSSKWTRTEGQVVPASPSQHGKPRKNRALYIGSSILLRFASLCQSSFWNQMSCCAQVCNHPTGCCSLGVSACSGLAEQRSPLLCLERKTPVSSAKVLEIYLVLALLTPDE